MALIIIPYVISLMFISYILSKIIYSINNNYINMIIIFISILIQIDNFTLNQDLIKLNQEKKNFKKIENKEIDNKECIILIGELNLKLQKEKMLNEQLLIRKNKINNINWKLLSNKCKIHYYLQNNIDFKLLKKKFKKSHSY